MTKSRPVVLLPDLYWDGVSPAPVPGQRLLLREGQLLPVETPPPGVELRRLEGLLAPTFSNFHAHLELSHVLRPLYAGDFIGWLLHVIQNGPASPEAAGRAAIEGAIASYEWGISQIVDITRHPAATRAALATTPLHVLSCAEITGLGPRFDNGTRMLEVALGVPSYSNITAGLSPHAPYSTDIAHYEAAGRTGLPITTHLAETEAEREFLLAGTGSLRELWDRLDSLFPATGSFVGTAHSEHLPPIPYLAPVLSNLLAAHVNDATDEELGLLARHRTTVVHCPRTHAYFQRSPFDLARYLAAGVTVKVGTDSLASAPDLNVREDLLSLSHGNPHFPAHQLLQMALSETPHAYALWPVGSLGELLGSPQVKPTEMFPVRV